MKGADPKNWPAFNVETRAVNDLIPYARNSRKHSDEQIAQIAASIREWGFTNPVLIDPDGGIIAGHGRVMALRLLGIDTVPVTVARGWSDAQIKAYVIADNKLAMNAVWDDEMLKVELGDLIDLGFSTDLIGFDTDELADLLGFEDDGDSSVDEAPPPPKSTPILPGDLWILGAHRVYCGDSTERAAYGAVMIGHMADAVWTDPPDNVGYSSKAGAIKNDDMSDSSFAAFLSAFYRETFASMKPGASIYVAHADTEGRNFRNAFTECGLKLSGCLIWKKDSLVLGRSDYQWQHEPILYGWKPGHRHRWYGGRRQTTFLDKKGSIFTLQQDGSLRVEVGDQIMVVTGDNLAAQAIEPSVIRVEKPRRSAEHPTMKPTALIGKMLRNSTRTGDVVLDPFGGSGSTLIACEMLGRICRIIELDPIYCDVIIQRWQRTFGGEAVRESDGVRYSDIALEKGPATTAPSNEAPPIKKDPPAGPKPAAKTSRKSRKTSKKAA